MQGLYDRILGFMAGARTDSFEELALRIFAHQFESCEPYRRHCLSRGRTPATVGEWREIPAVPVEAFKQADLCCGTPERTFLSTGTTAGPLRRSRHLLPDLRLYHRSAMLGLKEFLFPDADRMRLVSLVPRSDADPGSSLAQMVTWAIEEFGDPGSECMVHGAEVDWDCFARALKEVERSGQPICLLTTTGRLIRVFDWARDNGLSFRLPHGSRLMDTGGDKGGPRRLSRKGVLHACWNTFALPGYFCVNEYGMAELSSQAYDSVLADRIAGRHRTRRKLVPHWLRTLALEPETLKPCPRGQIGLLCHFDLANAGSAMVVLSEDLGVAEDEGFQLLGRIPGAEARGCSLGVVAGESARTV